jgi:E3 ubiquitin-protein ligase RNF13
VKASGVNGIVYTAEPLNACGPLTIKAVEGPPSPFALIIRGGCTFDEKVKNAQDAGFKAAIVYDNENSNLPSHPHSVLLQFLNAICVAA